MRRSLPLFTLLFTAVCVAVQLSVGVYATGRSLTGDEASHMVNSLLVYDWLREGPLLDPVGYAQEYYRHFPRVTVGHWPPLLYVVQAGVFALAGRSSAAALGFQAVVAGLACALPASLVRRRLGWAAGLATGLAVLASPDLLFMLDAVMADTLLALLVLVAALCWARFAATGRTGWAVLFAAAASAAILTKGNGFALALLPLIHAVLTRSLRALLNPRTWLVAGIVAVATLPWYALTWQMTADGFNYAWGWDYTGRAVPAYTAGLPGVVGLIGLAGFAAALWTMPLWTMLGRRRAAPPDHELAALAAAALAVFLFQLVAPADITMRYLVALVPSAAVVAAVGLAHGLRAFRVRRAAVLGGATAALLLANAAAIFVAPHLSPFGMRALARDIVDRDGANPLVLVAADTRAEGALIAAFAELDPRRTHYVLRATQMLARGGFMAQGYATRFPDAGAVGRWLADSGIGWLVVDLSGEADFLPHDRQVAEIVNASGWTPVAVVERPGGEVRLYRLQAAPPTTAQLDALLSHVVPNTALALAQKNDSNAASTDSGASSAR
jgi:4-amino-4-deoxy-L-arabinose transferase-like glycosyltransferase